MSASAKAFYADLACVKNSEFEHVSAIRRGDSDGEITFKYSDANVEEPLDIQVVATDLNSYPHKTSFMVFTTSETCSTNIVRRLEQLSVTTRGSSLHSVIEAISNKLASRLDGTRHDLESDSNGDGDVENSEDDDEDLDLEEFEAIDVVDDEYFDNQAISEPMLDAETTALQDVNNLQRIQWELRLSRQAGFSVGIYSLQKGCPAGIVSLSIRVSKLNLPPTAIGAWGLETTDYLVLLFKFLGPYHDLAAMSSATPRSQPVVFRFGKCKTPKPSIQCARMAFRPTRNLNDEPDADLDSTHGPSLGRDGVEPSEEGQDKVNFKSIHMSNTIDDLLNRRFFKLLKLRMDHHCSWDMAQILLDESEGQGGNNERVSEIANSGEHSERPSSSTMGPPSLYYDDRMQFECTENLNFILVAMRLSLRRLCKCTEYCMVCHQRLRNDIQTLKPYVCSKSLCLYQYLSLAFGTSLEAEIVNSPYVVDLLISLFYSSLSTGSLREFQRGLTLKAPLIKISQDNVTIEFCPESSTFRILSSEAKLGEGDWVLVVTKDLNVFKKSIWRISQPLNDNLYSFQEIYSTANLKEISPSLQYQLFSTKIESLEAGWLGAILFKFSHDPDDMTKMAQRMSLQQLLDTVPSVLEMRKFLLEAPGRNLGAWTRMNRSALSLVRWIVASNTSYIVQDSAVPVPAPTVTENGITPPVPQEGSTQSGIIKGLQSSWMQFRFAQGSPDKESAFARAVQALCSTHPSKTVYPTLFAWHGSSLGNWHSIIRTGLDFSQISHGRSYGQGVYLSRNMRVSKGYMNMGHMLATSIIAYHDSPWHKSVLRPKSALSICEIVNCPDEFVSQSPHFVINKTEWIQCRYLLLQVDPTEAATQNPIFSALPCPERDYVKQDPGNHILGERDEPLDIPTMATLFAKSCQRDGVAETKKVCNDVEPISTDASQDGDVGCEEGDDPEALTEKIQAMMTAMMRGVNGHDSRVPCSKVEEAPAQPVSKTSVNVQQDFGTASNAPMSPLSRSNLSNPSTFRPGTLDLTTLPQLPEPAWAVSSRIALQTLAREIRELHKTQLQNDAASLGWYCDTAKISNLFQWIVELHTFDADLPLAKDMMRNGHTSVVLEIRFGSNFPMCPPFVRVIRPRFLPFHRGGGGHVTAGGAICSEMLTGSGWSPAMSMENVFVQIRLALCDTERFARLDTGPLVGRDYGIKEAVEAYVRAARTHGWTVPQDVKTIEMG
ncbi:hypothetical protein E4U21_002996 [Claviceps maximensis]|nr:hypothetical protein E4U21_002996 [Claviceps maximensis]